MTQKKISLTDRVAITNIRDWEIHFRGIESAIDIVIPSGAKNYKKLTVAEVDAQVKSGNVAFVGTDDIGTNASIKILDDDIRKYVFNLTDEEKATKQFVLDKETLCDVLQIKDKKSFEEKIKKLIVSESDKKMVANICKESNLDDFEGWKKTIIQQVSDVKF